MVRVFRPGVLFEVKEKGELIVASGILSSQSEISQLPELDELQLLKKLVRRKGAKGFQNRTSGDQLRMQLRGELLTTRLICRVLRIKLVNPILYLESQARSQLSSKNSTPYYNPFHLYLLQQLPLILSRYSSFKKYLFPRLKGRELHSFLSCLVA